MSRHFIKSILVSALLLGTAFVSVAQDKVVDQIVAIVGSNPILKSDIETQAIQMQAEGQTTEGDIKCEILETLLEQKLLLAEAELDTNIVITDNQINQNMDRRMKYFIENIGSEKEVEKYFNKSINQLKSDMSEMIKEQLKTEEMQNNITKKVTSTPSEVRTYFRQLPKDKIPMVGSQVEYAQITILPVITEQEDLEVKSKLREFKRRVEGGENFATLAVLYSEDPGSARNGGEMDYVGRAQLDPAFATEAFNLKVGAVSKVVKSEFGYHIIQLIDKRGEKIKCRHILIRPKIDPIELEKSKTRIDSLALFIQKKSMSWEQAAYLYSSDKNTRNNGGLVTSQRTGSSKFQMEELDPDVSKLVPELKVGEISAPFLGMDEKQRQVYKIIKLISRSTAHPANLQEDYQYLSEVFIEKKKEDTYRAWIAKQQSKTYIHIDDLYSNCNFKLKSWKK
ncbi:MAG TPA: peptidylprolyl isomerase [Prolixibacteraceae bacterium]|nr:peptidylprolyl isomerase [Prolixibacteraceae bacterium]